MTLTGSLSIRAHVKRGRTVLKDSYYDGAFKLSRPVYLEDDHPTFYFMHVGGGYVGGDAYSQSIVLEEGAQLSVTTQSATKVYKAADEPAAQDMHIVLEKGSFLSIVQDPVILYENARYVQTASVHLKENAAFFMTDILTPGWAESGELFTYHDIRSKIKVYCDSRLVLLDHLYLKPQEQMNSMMMMEGYSHFGTLLFLHEKADESVMQLFQQLAEKYEPQARIGFSALAIKGVAMRVLAYRTQVIEAIFHECETIVRERVLHKQAIQYRKY